MNKITILQQYYIVYLLQNKEQVYEAYCIDKRGTDGLFLIPELDMQTTLKFQGERELNDKVNLKIKAVDITTQISEFEIQ